MRRPNMHGGGEAQSSHQCHKHSVNPHYSTLQRLSYFKKKIKNNDKKEKINRKATEMMEEMRNNEIKGNAGAATTASNPLAGLLNATEIPPGHGDDLWGMAQSDRIKLAPAPGTQLITRNDTHGTSSSEVFFSSFSLNTSIPPRLAPVPGRSMRVASCHGYQASRSGDHGTEDIYFQVF